MSDAQADQINQIRGRALQRHHLYLTSLRGLDEKGLPKPKEGSLLDDGGHTVGKSFVVLKEPFAEGPKRSTEYEIPNKRRDSLLFHEHTAEPLLRLKVDERPHGMRRFVLDNVLDDPTNFSGSKVSAHQRKKFLFLPLQVWERIPLVRQKGYLNSRDLLLGVFDGQCLE